MRNQPDNKNEKLDAAALSKSGRCAHELALQVLQNKNASRLTAAAHRECASGTGQRRFNNKKEYMQNQSIQNILNEEIVSIVNILSPAPAGHQNGTVKDLLVKSGTDEKGVPFSHLVLIAQLDEKDDDGNPFIVEKQYNLLGRGPNSFCNDCRTVFKVNVQLHELKKFNKGSIRGKQATFDIRHKKLDGVTVGYVSEILALSAATK